MNDLTTEVQEYRSNICKVFLVTAALIAIPALFASLYRINDIGWQPIMAAHIIIAIILWYITLFRNTVPYKYQASFIVVMFLAIGLGGLWQFGLIAGGVAFLVTASPIATLFFGGRAGLAILFVVFSFAAAIGLLTVSGNLKHDIDVAVYAVSTTSWLTSVIGWGLASAALTASLHVFNGRLIHSVQISRRQQEELNARQLVLEKTIEEKEKALNEIKTLHGIIPICSYCHSIRSDDGAWDQLEAYISSHSEATFSHGICPKCLKIARKKAELDDE